jgi:hypothetical protein
MSPTHTRILSLQAALQAALWAAVRSDPSCSLVNRNTFTAVLDSMTPAERSHTRFGQGRKIACDRDTVVASAAGWLEPGELATVDKRGTLHLTARCISRHAASHGAQLDRRRCRPQRALLPFHRPGLHPAHPARRLAGAAGDTGQALSPVPTHASLDRNTSHGDPS